MRATSSAPENAMAMLVPNVERAWSIISRGDLRSRSLAVLVQSRVHGDDNDKEEEEEEEEDWSTAEAESVCCCCCCVGKGKERRGEGRDMADSFTGFRWNQVYSNIIRT